MRPSFTAVCWFHTISHHHQSMPPAVHHPPPTNVNIFMLASRFASLAIRFKNSGCLTRPRLRAMVAMSIGGVLLLLLLEATITPPEALPFLHPTLNALYSCANLLVAYGIGVYWQWREGGHGDVRIGVESERHPSREMETKKCK